MDARSIIWAVIGVGLLTVPALANDPTRGEVNYIHNTEAQPFPYQSEGIYPGIYFWKVTSLMPGSEGKVQKGTFAVIK